MLNKKFKNYSKIPLKQLSNRVWRTYQGGALINRWKRDAIESDGNFPEEWIMSTISARGKNRPLEEGLSILDCPSGLVSLQEMISEDLALFIGDNLAKKIGTTGLLIKMLDSKERLTIQVHPDKEYACTMLNSAFGKTESWYILGGREINGEKSAIYLGFKEGVTPEIWENYFYSQNIQGMLNSLHRFEVQPGDAFMIYGGVPHAIGSGCFLMEVQEPTDYTMRVEKITPGGLTISDELIHQGVGEENMLKCFHYDACSFGEATSRWKISPEIINSSNSYCLKSIFNKKHTNCFALSELVLNGEYMMSCFGSFFVGVIYIGDIEIECEGVVYNFKQGDEIFFPAGIKQVALRSKQNARILLCYPPS